MNIVTQMVKCNHSWFRKYQLQHRCYSKSTTPTFIMVCIKCGSNKIQKNEQ